MDIILYSTGCPRCKVLKKKLESKGITYIEDDSTEDMAELGISYVPVLSVNGEFLEFSDAIKWISEQ